MYIIYCLTNESFKDNIVNIGITNSIDTIDTIDTNYIDTLLEGINNTCLPTPYNVFITKNVHNHNSIVSLYSLLYKFGKKINGPFFEISREIIKPLFELIEDDSMYSNIILQDKIKIVQNEIEYIIPKAIDSDENIYRIINDLDLDVDLYYDHLSRVDYDDIDL
jgi:hypothetical protein